MINLLQILILMLPIIDKYRFPILINNASTMAMICYLLLILIFLKGKIVFKKNEVENLSIFCIVVLLCSLILSSIINYKVSNFDILFRKYIANIVFVILLVLAKSSSILSNSFLKKYIFLVGLSSTYAIMQTISAYIFDIGLPANIISKNITEEVYNAFYEYSYTNVYRAQSFFVEPASYAVFSIPAIILLLFYNGALVKNKKLYVMIISIGIISSTSSTGILMLILVFAIYIYKKFREHFFQAILILAICSLIFMIVMDKSIYISNSLHSIMNLNSVSAKSGDRVFRGFAVYSKLPFLNQLCGIGSGNGKYFINSLNIVTIYDSKWSVSYDYYNGISSSLIYAGLVGLLSYAVSFINFIKSKSICQKLIAFVAFILSFGCSIYFNTLHMILLLVIIACKNDIIKSK